ERRCGVAVPVDAPLARDRMRWSTALSEWASSAAALSAVRALGVAGADLGRRILTLVPRRGTAAQACRILQRHGLQAAYAVSGMGGRDRVIERFREGEVQALVATQLA